MKYILVFLLLLSGVAYGQTRYYIRADSTVLEKVGGSNELVIKNDTRDSLGALVNIGGGKTAFRRFRQNGDTLFLGLDTAIIVAGGSGSTNDNVGSAYRLAIPNTNDIKTLNNRFGIDLDSADANQIGIIVDTVEIATKLHVADREQYIMANNINNQVAVKQDANFRIDGYGRFGDTRTAIGVVSNYNFNEFGVASTYDSSLATVTINYSGTYAVITNVTPGTFTSYIAYKGWTGRNRYTQSVKFMPTAVGATAYGVSMGTESTNSFYAAGVRVQFSVAGGTGTILFWNDAGTLIYTGTSTTPVSANDTLICTMSRQDYNLYGTLYNKTTGIAVTASYAMVSSSVTTMPIPGTGKYALYFNGSNLQVFNHTISSNETKNNVVISGNSITAGYSASTMPNRYASLIFPSRMSYEISGGSGDRSAEGAAKLPENVLSTPKHYVLNLGVNDAQAGVATSTFSTNIVNIVTTLQAIGTNVIIVSASPVKSASIVPYNDTLQAIATRYSLKYINTYDSLKHPISTGWNPVYCSADSVHPNNAGHLVISRIIAREAPEILGDTSIYVNRPQYVAGATDFLTINPETGLMALSTPPVVETSGFVQLTPASQQTGTINVSSTINTAGNITAGGTIAATSTVTGSRLIAGTSIGSFLDVNGSVTGAVLSSWRNQHAAGYVGMALYNSSNSLFGTIAIANPSAAATTERNNLQLKTLGGTGRVELFGGNASGVTIPDLSAIGSGRVGIGHATPTAWLHMKAGAAAASSAPLKFTSGTNLTTAEAGAMEYDGSNFFLSPSTTRKRIPLFTNATPGNGEILIGNGTDFTKANITSTGSTVTVTNGAGTINLEVATTLASGTFTPSITNTTNIASSTGYDVQYLQVGNTVTVSGRVDITTTATGTTELRMSVPVSNGNFSANWQAGGTAHPVDKNTSSVGVSSVSGSVLVAFIFVSDDTSAHSYWFSYTYQILIP